MPHDLPLLLARIDELVEADADAATAPRLAEMEHTLTDGYAKALALEGDRLRIQKELADVARSASGTLELARLRELAERLERAETDLTRLRAMLERLRTQTTLARNAAAG